MKSIIENIKKYYEKLKEARPQGVIDAQVALGIICLMVLVNLAIITIMINNLGCVFCVLFNALAASWYVWTWRK